MTGELKAAELDYDKIVAKVAKVGEALPGLAGFVASSGWEKLERRPRQLPRG